MVRLNLVESRKKKKKKKKDNDDEGKKCFEKLLSFAPTSTDDQLELQPNT